MSTILEYILESIHKNLTKSEQEQLYAILDRELFDEKETSIALYAENTALKAKVEQLKEKLAYANSTWEQREE